MNLNILKYSKLAASVLVLFATRVSTAGPIYTTNLMIQLDGTNLPADSSAISEWIDQKTNEDGDDSNNHQDFGQGTSGKRPVARDMTMPNGTTKRVAEFNRGLAAGSSNSASTTSDFLQGRTGGLAAGAFGGADANFNFGGTPGDDGVSWFIVHRSRVVSTGAGSSMTPQNQGVLNVAHTTANVYWGTFYASDAGSGTVNERTDLYHTTRDTTAPPTGPLQQNHPLGDVADPSSWYISAVSWNLDTGVVESKFLHQDQTTTSATINGAAYTVPFSAHTFSTLGGRSTNTTTSGAHLDGWIAEVLVYKSALGAADMNSVVQYLNDTYFIPEPGSATLISLAILGSLLQGRRRARAGGL